MKVPFTLHNRIIPTWVTMQGGAIIFENGYVQIIMT